MNSALIIDSDVSHARTLHRSLQTAAQAASPTILVAHNVKTAFDLWDRNKDTLRVILVNAVADSSGPALWLPESTKLISDIRRDGYLGKVMVLYFNAREANYFQQADPSVAIFESLAEGQQAISEASAALSSP